MKTEGKKNGKEKFLKASITVEASYIMPSMLGVIFAVMVISFYFHDAVTAKAILDRNIARLENVLIHPLEKDSYYYDYSAVNERFLDSFFGNYELQEDMEIEQIEKELNASLMLLHTRNIDVQIKNKKLAASVELFYGIALPGTEYLPFFKKIRTVTTNVSVYNQADFIRILTIDDKL